MRTRKKKKEEEQLHGRSTAAGEMVCKLRSGAGQPFAGAGGRV